MITRAETNEIIMKPRRLSSVSQSSCEVCVGEIIVNGAVSLMFITILFILNACLLHICIAVCITVSNFEQAVRQTNKSIQDDATAV